MATKSKKPLPASTATTDTTKLYGRTYAARLARQVDQELGVRRPPSSSRGKKKSRA